MVVSVSAPVDVSKRRTLAGPVKRLQHKLDHDFGSSVKRFIVVIGMMLVVAGSIFLHADGSFLLQQSHKRANSRKDVAICEKMQNTY